MRRIIISIAASVTSKKVTTKRQNEEHKEALGQQGHGVIMERNSSTPRWKGGRRFRSAVIGGKVKKPTDKMILIVAESCRELQKLSRRKTGPMKVATVWSGTPWWTSQGAKMDGLRRVHEGATNGEDVAWQAVTMKSALGG